MKKALVMAFLAFQFTQAQELETILLAADDAEQLSENYLNPVAKGLMYSMNGGWYTTAKTHKLFGFDLTINANASFVPDADKVFSFVQNEYNYLSLPNDESSLPTIMNDNDAQTAVDVHIPYENDTYKATSFEMPGGITGDLPVNAVPAPVVQLGLGIPLKTDVKLRLVPKLNFDDTVEASLFGFGIQHDVLQHFKPQNEEGDNKGKKELPLNVSILAAFTNMNVSYNMANSEVENVQSNNGKTEFKLNTWTVQAIGSIDYKIISFYSSLGYNHGKTTIDMKGDYTLTYDVEDNNGNYMGTVSETITDPIGLGFDANGMRASIGTRINLFLFKIFADYTIQEYNTATVGITFSFR